MVCKCMYVHVRIFHKTDISRNRINKLLTQVLTGDRDYRVSLKTMTQYWEHFFTSPSPKCHVHIYLLTHVHDTHYLA